MEGREDAAPHMERVLARAVDPRREDVGCIARNSAPARACITRWKRDIASSLPAGVRGYHHLPSTVVDKMVTTMLPAVALGAGATASRPLSTWCGATSAKSSTSDAV